MSNKIDIIYNTILEKEQLINNVIAIYKNNNIDIENVSNIENKFKKLIINFKITSVDFINKYYTYHSQNNNTECESIINSFMMYVERDDIFFYIQKIVNELFDIYNNLDIKHAHLSNAVLNSLNSIGNNNFSSVNMDDNYKICKYCKKPMNKNKILSEYNCEICGYSSKIYGIILEFNNNDLGSFNHGKYDPNKHCKFWIDRLQAKESIDIPQNIIDDIKKLINRDKINLKHIKCSDIRIYLKELKKTCFNEHIILIHKMITGKNPPIIKETEKLLIEYYFDKATKIFMEYKSNKKSNVPYHPYIIFKILEQIIPEKENDRKYKLLSYIYLQSKETLIEKDVIWKKICEKITDFTYIPTDKSLYDY